MRSQEFVSEDQIPARSVIQGYTVTYNPAAKTITFDRGGQRVGSARINTRSLHAYQQIANRFIERLEDERFPDDLEVREGSVFGQQDFDTQMALAKMQSTLSKQKAAQSAPVDITQPEQPQKLADLQRQHAVLAPIVNAKKEIEAIKSTLTRGGRALPPGLAADLEDYYTMDDIQRYPQEVLAKYQQQLAALQKYASLKKAVWRR